MLLTEDAKNAVLKARGVSGFYSRLGPARAGKESTLFGQYNKRGDFALGRSYRLVKHL